MITLDMLGNPCPIPVIEAKKELANDESKGVIVLVDNVVAVQNLKKMSDGMGFSFSDSENNGVYTVTIEKNGKTFESSETNTIGNSINLSKDESPVVLIKTNEMGVGSEELGAILMKGYIFSLTELSPMPKTVIFLNSGVKLSTEGSNVLTDLKKLEDAGCEILSCGTCLNYYELTDKLSVGKITDMFDISNKIANTTKLISL